MTTSRTIRRHRPAALTLASALLLTLTVGSVLAGCSGGSDSKDAGGVSGDVPASARVASSDGMDSSVDSSVDSAAATGSDGSEVQARALISHGTVSLRAPDVADARFDVQKVVDRYGGEISDERTDTDEDGKLHSTHLVVRVPAADFAAAMDALSGVGDLEYSSAKTQDVTTRVIDVQSRLRVQRRSIERITTLLARAQNLRDIVLIESQLSRRQAELDSLERQSAYLADQTSLSTITVDVERTPKPAHRDRDETGFLAGLSAGWHGLTTLAVGLATALGAVLPFAAVGLVLAALALPLVRSLRRRRHHPDDPMPVEG
jgi:hypothetical protein